MHLLRLMGLIFTALLALSMAIFPIAMPRAAVPSAQPAVAQHLDAQVHGDAAHSHDEVALTCAPPADHHGCGDHDPGSHDGDGTECCGMGACHAFQLSAAPDLRSPCLMTSPIGAFGDEQVEGLTPGGLDRPPRTV